MKKIKIMLIGIGIVFLVGCSKINSMVEEKIVEQSGVLSEQSYTDYLQYDMQGLLDANGHYDAETFIQENGIEETDEEPAPYGIHVSFMKNSNFNIVYSLDPTFENNITADNCYLDPGSVIYAKVEVDNDVISSMYYFDHFELYSVSSSDDRKLIENTDYQENKEIIEIHLPIDFDENDISIEPVGRFIERKIQLDDSFIDENNKKVQLSGTWMINDEPCVEDNVLINPLSSYIVSYKYDTSNYFFCDSTPECFFNNEEEGEIFFNKKEADENTENYSVTLHTFLTVNVPTASDRQAEVQVNDNEPQKESVVHELSISNLKYGDQITVKTDSKWQELEDSSKLLLTSDPINTNGKWTYYLTVPENNGCFLFIPTQYKYEHGEVSFKCFGREIRSAIRLAPKSRIYYSEKSADAGYWLGSNEMDYIVVSDDEEETKQKLNSIHFMKKNPVSIELEYPKFGGDVKYTLDGKYITDNVCQTYSGSQIDVELSPWPGWYNRCEKVYTYEVTSDIGQEILIPEKMNSNEKPNEYPISEVFIEDEAHKPELTVKLEKSVGTDMQFQVTAANLNKGIISHRGGWFATELQEFEKIDEFKDVKNLFNNPNNIITDTEEVISHEKIGTQDGISITMGGKSIPSGKAIRVITIKQYDSGKVDTNTTYLPSIDDKLPIIDIYDYSSGNLSSSNCKSVEISIGIVEVAEYTSETPASNIVISLKKADTSEVIHSGDLLEPTQKIVLEIKPKNSSYYLTGKDASDTCYRKEMKFSDYIENIKDIISKHPVQRYIYVTLDRSESFAEYEYMLDGKPIQGNSIKAQAGQTLELTYTVTNSDYQLQLSSNHLLALLSSNRKVTKKITIDPSMDNTLITREMFGIAVEIGG